MPLSLGDGKKPKPVTAFAEWTDTPDPFTGRKRLVWFGVNEAELFCFAGIWRPTPDGERFAFLTTKPNALVAPVHAKAMPVIVAPDDYTTWLTADYADACPLAKPYPAARMTIVPAS